MSNSQIVNALNVKFGHDSVMGYFRPYSGFNKGKKSEFNERKWFVEEKTNCPCSRESEYQDAA